MSLNASLADLLALNADINFYTQMQIFWQNKYEANSKKLQKQVKYEEKWENAYDSALDNTRELKAGNIVVQKENQSEKLADAYAHAKVKEYNEALSIELSELDVEYDTIRTMYDTLLQEKRTWKDSLKQVVSTEAQDTHLLGQ